MLKKYSGGVKMNEKKQDVETYLAEIEKVLPPIVFRNWPRWRDVLPMSPRTLANEDCLGVGPKESIYLGRHVGYPRAAFMEYLRAKTRAAR
jgi:hypothetical protein